MQKNDISARLKCIADMVSPGYFVCDVGCDHGFLPIYLTAGNRNPGALAMDIGQGPIQAAAEHIEQAGLTDRIETRLSDGLHALTPGEVRKCFGRAAGGTGHTSLVMAGMGGPLILKILGECPKVRDAFDEIVISPQSRISDVRKGLEELHLTVINEKMVSDADKYYTVMRLKNSHTLTEAEKKALGDRADTLAARAADAGVSKETLKQLVYDYGPDLLAGSDEVFGFFLEYECDILGEIIDQLDPAMHGARYIEVREQLKRNSIAHAFIS